MNMSTAYSYAKSIEDALTEIRAVRCDLRDGASDFSDQHKALGRAIDELVSLPGNIIYDASKEGDAPDDGDIEGEDE